MNTFDFDNGASLALARFKTFSRHDSPEDYPRCLSRSDQRRISRTTKGSSQQPAKRLNLEERLTHLDRDAFEIYKDGLSPRWQAMYTALENGQCSRRFAMGLLKGVTFRSTTSYPITLEKYALQIAVHEVAAFAGSQDRRMQMRIKKKIPQALFTIWAEGIQSQPESDMVRFIRDAYLNLSQSGLEHLGFYFIVFSKVTESQPAFETYLQTIDPAWRDLCRSFRMASLKSSRTYLSATLTSRIDKIVTQLEESS